MLEVAREARRKILRDRDETAIVLLRKSIRYALELATAPVYLLAVDRVGRGVRTLKRPRIENLGEMEIGTGTLLRSVNVPVELFSGPRASLIIGRDVRLNYGVSIAATGSIRIGDRVRIGPYAMIIDTTFHDPHDRSKVPEPQPIVIEDDVWIGAKASILPGVRIGRGAIIGVSAVVSANVEPFTVVAGNPARAVKKLEPDRFVVP
jgi:acetyltransferase-like isoleucine patch superfamily enzyme